MPNPWDSAVLDHNLALFAGLTYGDRVLPADLEGKFRKVSSDDGEYVEAGTAMADNDQFLGPVLVVFRAACRRQREEEKTAVIRLRPMTAARIQEALSGLHRVWQTSSGAVSKALRKAMDESQRLLDQANIPEEQLQLEGARDFQERHGKFLLFRMNQKIMLPSTNDGVCKALCWDWIRRKLLADKDSWAVSCWDDEPALPRKPGDHLRSANLANQDRDRIERKIHKRLLNVHHTYRSIGAVRHTWPKFAGLAEEFVGQTDVKYQDGRLVPDPKVEHGLMQWILHTCVRHMEAKLLGHATFYIIISGWEKSGAGETESSHAVAMELHGKGRLHFFDPNLGEFEFHPVAEVDQMMAFAEDLWSFYRKIGWRLSSLSIMRYYRDDRQNGPVDPMVLRMSLMRR